MIYHGLAHGMLEICDIITIKHSFLASEDTVPIAMVRNYPKNSMLFVEADSVLGYIPEE